MSTQWPPSAYRADNRICQNCGNQVTNDFARVFGDNCDIVHACPECATYREMNTAAPNADGGRP